MFMMAYGFDCMTPTLQSLLLYLKCLVNSFKNITSIKNYISGARTFLSMSGGNTAPFISPILAMVIRGAARLSTHVPRPAPPLGRLQLHCLCSDFARLGVMAGWLWQLSSLGWPPFCDSPTSSLNPPLGGGGGSPPALPLRCLPGGGALLVNGLNYNYKTRLRGAAPTTLMIAPARGSPFCPVNAFLWAWRPRAFPASPSSPLFLLPSSGYPLTSRPAVLGPAWCRRAGP